MNLICLKNVDKVYNLADARRRGQGPSDPIKLILSEF